MTEHQRSLANRYKIGNLIGRGGMADVYEGFDTRLGRTVAIKLLKADLARDPAFESRFRQEAQASARMGHPTIVRIYDAGEEVTSDEYGNQHKYPFIVMEYVKGKLLREILHERRLTLRETIEWTNGVLTALEFSHRAGVIHRDIKSANVMITDAGQVKVMDFGIARAISDSSVTQAHTSGIVGTAQYFSPEQARGEQVDARTDLYSTGVLLYEMLCGRPPFKGDTAVSVAYQHVSEAVIVPSRFDPAITPEMDAVVLRSLAKDREKRFQTAEEFREHLIAAINGSPVTVASRTASRLADPTQVVSNSILPKTPVVAPIPTALDGDFETLLSNVGSTTKVLPSTPEVAKGHDKVQAEETPVPNPFASIGVELPTKTNSSQRSKSIDPERPSKSVMVTISSAAAVIIIGLIVWLVAFGNFNLDIKSNKNGITVPDVVGQTYNDGYNTLTSKHLLVSKTAEPSDTVPIDSIIRIEPVAGTIVDDRQLITVYVSGGATTVKVPSLVGLTETAAASALTTLKLTLGTITQGNSARVPAGQVIETLPMLNTQVPEGSVVNLIISNGKVMVPDVRNLDISVARATVTGPSVGLPVSIDTRQECAGAQGTIVVEQSIPPGLAKQGSAIVLYVGCAQ